MKIKNLLLYIFLIAFFIGCKGKAYRAPSASMEGTIMTGDIFYVKKTTEFKRNDIIVFDYYGEDYRSPIVEGKYKMQWSKRVYRLIAMSGDTLNIKDGDVYVNGRFIPLPPTAMGEYIVASKVLIDDFPATENEPPRLISNNNKDSFLYEVRLTKAEAADYEQRKPAIMSIQKKSTNLNIIDNIFAKSNVTGNWTVDNYGPLIIPFPGETISVDTINSRLYHNIPGISNGENKIKETLYFVMGDNRHGAEDSRFIGLITHSKMVGIVK